MEEFLMTLIINYDRLILSLLLLLYSSITVSQTVDPL
jgi:hypothetical protein